MPIDERRRVPGVAGVTRDCAIIVSFGGVTILSLCTGEGAMPKEVVRSRSVPEVSDLAGELVADRPLNEAREKKEDGACGGANTLEVELRPVGGVACDGGGGEGRLLLLLLGVVLVAGEEKKLVLSTETGGVTGAGVGFDDVTEYLLISGDGTTLLASVELLVVFLFDSKSATSSGAAVMLFISASYTILYYNKQSIINTNIIYYII